MNYNDSVGNAVGMTVAHPFRLILMAVFVCSQLSAGASAAARVCAVDTPATFASIAHILSISVQSIVSFAPHHMNCFPRSKT